MFLFHFMNEPTVSPSTEIRPEVLYLHVQHINYRNLNHHCAKFRATERPVALNKLKIHPVIESEHFPLIGVKCCIRHEMKEQKKTCWRAHCMEVIKLLLLFFFFKQGAIAGSYDETMEGSVFPP